MGIPEEFLKFVADTECNVDDNFYWNSDLKFFVLANDLFYWGMSDAIEIETSDDINLLRKCLEDSDDNHFSELYCCRKTKMRPQGACYKHIKQKYWYLFDACGPERDVNFGNPVDH